MPARSGPATSALVTVAALAVATVCAGAAFANAVASLQTSGTSQVHRGTGVPSPSPSPSWSAPGPATSGPAVRRDPLGAAATAFADGRADRVLAAVYDIGTGRQWTLGTGNPQAAASVVKLDILETLLARFSLTGQPVPAGDLSIAQNMMEDSDNAAATTLWQAAGGPPAIQAFNAAAGLRGTTVSTCVACPGFQWPGWGLTMTTAQDQIALLRQLVSPTSLLTESQQGYVLASMRHVVAGQGWGVSSGVPPGVTVALKDGWLPLTGATDWQVNSVGWIRGDGRDYLIAVLTTGSATEQYGIDTIDRLAAMVWRNMG